MKMTYAVFLVRLKNRQVEKRGVKWVVCIKTKQEWDELKKMAVKSQMRAIFNKKSRRYSKIVKEYRENPRIEKGLREAYEMALQLREEKKYQSGGIKIHGIGDEANHRVYLMRMDPLVWKNEVFRKANQQADLSNPPVAWYVGQTGLEIPDRYANHRSYSGSGKKSVTEWGKKYFLEPFDRAFDDLAQSLRAEFALTQEAHRGVENLNHIEAKINELEFAEWLRSKGYGAYAK